MKRNVLIVVLVCVIIQCNGHLPSLTGIISNAHKHVHHTVQGVANTVLGQFNVDGHVQVGGDTRPQPHRPTKEEQPEMIIVIVEETADNNHGPGPYNQQNQYNNRPPGHHGHNNYEHRRPWQNQNNNYNNRPYEHQHTNYGEHPNNYGNHNNYGHNHNQHYANQNDYNRPEQTTQGYVKPNNNYNNRPSDQSPGNNGHTYPNNYGTTQPPPAAETRPTFASIRDNEGHTQKPYQNIKTTTESDVPEFVALNPNEYVYGGDKITVTAPKRDTDNDDAIPIDIRFQDNK